MSKSLKRVEAALATSGVQVKILEMDGAALQRADGKLVRKVKWSGKTGQRAKMYPTLMTGYTNDEETQFFRQV